MWRVLVIALVVNGLVPAFGEGVEALVHLTRTGHVAHDVAHHEQSESDEHGCGPIAHHCGCCHSQPVLPETFVEAPALETHSLTHHWPDAHMTPAPPLGTPFRPPIV